MKRIAIIAAALAALASCGSKNTPALTGNLQGLESDFLLFFFSGDGEMGSQAMDTVYLDNGKFIYNLPAQETGELMFVEVNHFLDNVSLYMVPGENAVITGTLANYEITGSPFYEDWNKFRKMTAQVEKARHDLLSTLPDDEEEDGDFDMDQYSATDRALTQQWNHLAMQFIEENPESDLSAYLASRLRSADDFYAADEIISDKVKKGKLGHLIANKSLSLDAEALRQESMKTVFVGADAPDFTLETSTGETFALSEHRGEYILLDFWGTWCGWCIEGLPTVKEIAHTYKDRLTVVSVDTGDGKQAWLEGIAKYGMDWVQVYNSREDAIDSIFGVQGFPGFYLINPEGKIELMEFGEPERFVELIGELINK